MSPKLSVTPPIAILEFANLSFAIDPSSWAFVMVPVRSVVGKLPLKVVAVITPVTLMPPVPVINLLLISKFPPSCGVVSPTDFSSDTSNDWHKGKQ